MARPLRLEYENAVYHVTSRGNSGTEIFADDVDREHFLEILANAIDRFGWICHAYCLMTTHYHVLVETPEPNLSRGMRHLNGVYTQWFNRQHSRFGHLVQGRFKSTLVEKESYLLELARYIVLNPVRAKMVRSARDWGWSSYRATAGQTECPEFLTTNWLLSQFGDDRNTATVAYRDFVKQGLNVNILDNVKAGVLLGSDSFVHSLRPLLRDIEGNREFRREERRATRPTLDELFADVTDKATRNERIHAAVRIHQYGLQEVGDHLGLCYSTISVIAKRIAESIEP